MAEKLTPQQAMAVSDRGGNLLVSAAAGSGKTKVLVDRLLRYLTDPNDPANLDDFLIITYTKAAASELRGKIAAKLTERISAEPENRHLQKQMQRLFLTKISTVHGFCTDILREYAYRLDLAADFRVADENECREIRELTLSDLLDRSYETMEDDSAFRFFVDSQGLGRDDRLIPEIVFKVYDSARCHLDPEAWLDSCVSFSPSDAVTDASSTVWGAYLIREFQAYLDCQIRIMTQCVDHAQKIVGFEKVVLNLKNTLLQLDALRQCTTWDAICNHRTIDYGRLTFPRKCEDPELVERIKAVRIACKKGMEKHLRVFSDLSERVLQDLRTSMNSVSGLVYLVRAFEKEYTLAKRSRHCLDFSDLEHKTLDLLLGTKRSGPTAAAREIGARYREIMVDEYQDSNGVQDAIFSTLSQGRNNCFMVGDVKQSIYQFRLADPSIFLDKYHKFVPAESAVSGQGRKVLLSHNFRSGSEIVDAVNAVFSTCMTPKIGGLYYGEAEALREGIPHERLPDPAVSLYTLQIREDTYGEESCFVADQICKMLHDGTLIRKNGELVPVQPEDIVILLRSPGSVGGYYQRALESRGISCSSGGGNDLLQAQEVATLRSLLKTVYNPRQDIPLVSALASPVFSFSADELAAIRAKRRGGSFYDAILRDDTPKTKKFVEILLALRKQARMNTLAELLESCFALTQMDSVYAAMSGGEGRITNLQIFYQLACDFEATNHRNLGQFLEYLDAMEEKGLITAGNAATGSVTIMSIHKSKGLEFPVVFLCGLSREFNRESVRAQILCDKELGLGMNVVDMENRIRYPSISKRAIAAKMTAESISEEMRVLYVAMTRARDRLIMTYSARNLEADLQDIVLRMDFDGAELLCSDAVCPGDWILLTALGRTEAGELFSIAGSPLRTAVADIPWNIRVKEAPEPESGSIPNYENRSRMPADAEHRLQHAMEFRYSHLPATMAPSKQTATGRKGRVKDTEAAEHTQQNQFQKRTWRSPSFAGSDSQGVTYGNAFHAAMQFLRYECCDSKDGVSREISRLVDERFITREQGAMIECERISAFFDTELGRKLQSGASHLREFKFSILDDGSNYGQGLEGEHVLLQGVVDCALLEEDGITVIDFKTDRVTDENLDSVVSRYSSQVQTYGEALAKIYEKPIKSQLLYFFALDRFVSV